MSNAIPNRRESPLYTDAVYGIRKINEIAEAAILKALLSKRLPK